MGFSTVLFIFLMFLLMDYGIWFFYLENFIFNLADFKIPIDA